MMRRFSLTTRLTACYALVAAALLLGMGWLVVGMVQQHFVALDQETLGDKLNLVEGIVLRAHTPADIAPRLQEALQNHPGLFVRVSQAGSGAVVFASPGFAFPEPLVDSGNTPHSATHSAALLVWPGETQALRAMARSIEAPGAGAARWHIAAALDTQHHQHFMEALQHSLLAYAGVAAVLSAVLGWWAARTGLAPLRDMKARAQAVTAHKLDQRMPAESVPIEMADLAHSLNDMLQRLQADFQRLSEFSSDLAHELRTPISNLLTQTQVVLAHSRSVPQYQDTLASNAEEFQRLARMVSDMLLLAKAEHGLLLPSREAIQLQDEVRALVDFYEALADEKAVTVVCVGEGVVQGDRLMLRRAISNLLSNALRHTPRGGAVTIAIEGSAAAPDLRITNTGPAMASEHLPRVFDRFYRADKARAHPESDGAGLGLAITRAIVMAHGGQASVTSANRETTFVLRFDQTPAATGS